MEIKHILLILILIFAAWACIDSEQVSSRENPEKKGGNVGGKSSLVTEKKFDFDLSTATEIADSGSKGETLLKGEPISSGRAQEIFKRLPELPSDNSLAKDFNRRKDTMPAPRGGETIKVSFPPAEELAPPKVESEAEKEGKPAILERYSPQGNIDRTKAISLTFDRSMIALQDVQSANSIAPATIKPEVKGHWRWVGTKTALFEAEGTFLPMSTDYTVEVSKSLKDANGRPIEKDYSFNFTTATLKIIGKSPYAGAVTGPRPSFYLAFNQSVDVNRLKEFITLREGNSTEVEIEFLPAKDAAKEGFSNLKDLPDDRYVIFRPKNDLKADTKHTVTLAKGAVSQEGPLVTSADESYSFKTYPPLTIVDTNADNLWGRDSLSPYDDWIIRFSNSLDGETFAPKDMVVSVAPEVKNLNTSITGSTLKISGDFEANQKYIITISAKTTDIYGQTLGHDQKLAFKVGDFDPFVFIPGKDLRVLEATGPRVFNIYTGNVKKFRAKLFKVTPEDYQTFYASGNWKMRSFEDISKYKPLGKVVWSKTIKIKGSTSERVQTPIDLSEAFADKKYGLAMLALQFDNYSGDYDRKEVIWIQSSPIGLDIVSGRDSAYCLVNELVSGVPVAGAEVRLGEQSVKTDKNGLAILKRDKDKDYSEEYITASSKGCKVFYPAIANRIFGPNGRDTIGCRWSVFDDRGLYRPNESVHVKGWVRTLEDKPDKNCVLDPRLKEVVWTVKDPRNNKICDGKTAINEYGGFEFDFTLPDNMNLGNASINIACNDVPSLANRSTTHYFDVQEFRRPEFEVSSKVEGTDHLMNERAFVSAEAKYFAGGKLSDADIKWTANANRSSYSPPGWSEYTFGKWSPWWHCWWWPEEKSTAVSHTFSSKTDSLGKNVLQLDLGQNSPPTPVSISVSAAVSDVNRQTWSASSSFLVHPSELYVGVKTDRYYYSEGAEAEYNVVVTDIEGKAKAGVPVSIRWARIEDHFEDGKLIEKEIESFNDNFTSTAEASLRKLKFPKAGSWRLNAEVKDSKGRPNITTMRMWIGDCAAPQNTSVNVEEITLVPDKKEYKVGETAEILVQLPFTARQLTYTIARSGIAKSETISMQGDSTTLKIPLDKEWTPSVNLRVMAAGEAQRYDNAGKPIKDSLRPACAKGDLNLSIPAVEKSLKVEVLPAKQNLEPAGKTDIIVKVKDNSGKPVDDAEVALVVVDESVWALAGYNISDPLGNFYHARNQDVSQYLLRSMMVLQEQRIPKQASNREMEVQRGAMGGALNYAGAPRMVYKSVVRSEMTMDECVPMAECDAALADDEGGQDNGKPINVRTNFDALALFKGHLQTDKQGQVKVEVTLPDNLTRYRVVAVVADKDSRFGKGESSLTARLPLMVRPNAPRFLNFGDIVEVPVILHNQTERDLRTEVVYRASNLSIDNQGIVCLVPANTRREVRIPAKVKEVGEAQVQVAAVSGNYADSSLMKMPVYTPCTTEAFATYGSIESDKTLVQPIKAPKDAYKQFGGLEVSTSSTALQELVDAVLYLCNYPFACSEQLASRIIVTSNMYDVLSEFNVKELPKSEDVKRQINEDIKTMCSRQNSRGLFGLWEADDHNLPYVTVHCAQSLVIAKDKGYNVPQNKYNAALEALKNIDRYIDKKLYSEESRLVINTYAENVLWQVGKHDPKRLADRLSKFKMEEVPIEVLGWALPVLRDTHADLANEIRRVIANKTSETASTANVGNTREKDGYLIMDSDMRSEAVLLSGLITDNAKNSVIPKLVKTLLSGRKHGHWGNTQSNSMVVMALYKYFKTYEAVTPDFIANAWLGEDYVGQYKFKGRQTHYLESFIPMQQVGDESKLILDKKGPGRLYYRLGLSYASKDLNPKPYEGGFTVERVYEGVDDPKDVKQLADGTWKIKLGSRVRCKVKLVAPSRRAHVALTVPLPAGCEILNGAFKMTESVPTDNASKARQSYCWWWWDRPWYDHENLRDERAEAFSLVLYGGDYDYSFVCRATVPGKFIVPPAKAEEMYSPETFGRSGGAKVVIE